MVPRDSFGYFDEDDYPSWLGTRGGCLESLLALFLVSGCPKDTITCDSYHLRVAVKSLVEQEVMKHWLAFLFASGSVERFTTASDGDEEDIQPVLAGGEEVEDRTEWLWRLKFLGPEAFASLDASLGAPVSLFKKPVGVDSQLLLLRDWKRLLGLRASNEAVFFSSFSLFVLFLHHLASSEDVWRECEEKGKRVKADLPRRPWGGWPKGETPLAPACLGAALSEGH